MHRAFLARYGFTPGAYAPSTPPLSRRTAISSKERLGPAGYAPANGSRRKGRGTMDSENGAGPGMVRPCTAADWPDALQVINAAAQAYRGVIPPDRWREPYMPADELASEIADGSGLLRLQSGWLIGGRHGRPAPLERRPDPPCLRPARLAEGTASGSRLLAHLRRAQERPVLVGTWRAAAWAIVFYERHGFARVPEDVIAPLLRTYWSVAERQIATSLVLSSPGLDADGARRLIAEVRTRS